MKFIKAAIVIVFISACSNKQAKDRISNFENVLGKENSKMLTYLVSDFEKDLLKRQYPSLSTKLAYKKLLQEIRDGETQSFKKLSKKSIEKYNTSNLKKEEYRFPDSVWVVENSERDNIEDDSIEKIKLPFPFIKSRFKYINDEGTI